MIDIVLLGTKCDTIQNNEVSPANFNALTMFADVAVCCEKENEK